MHGFFSWKFEGDSSGVWNGVCYLVFGEREGGEGALSRGAEGGEGKHGVDWEGEGEVGPTEGPFSPLAFGSNHFFVCFVAECDGDLRERRWRDSWFYGRYRRLYISKR